MAVCLHKKGLRLGMNEKKYRGVVLSDERNLIRQEVGSGNYVFRFPYTFNKKIDGKWTGVGIENKKVTSSQFPKLIGKDMWSSVGGGILSFFKMTKETFDDYYTVRGAIAEMFVKQHLEAEFEKYGFGYEVLGFTQEMFDYDQFPKNEHFGGVLDIGIRQWDKNNETETVVRKTVEVKSKTLKRNSPKSKWDTEYESIVIKNQKPSDDNVEVLQGKFLGVMSSVEKILMAWVFFPEDIESGLRTFVTIFKADNNRLPTVDEVLKNKDIGINDVVIKLVQYDVDRRETLGQMYNSLKLIHNTLKNGYIPKDLFTDDEQQYLNDVLLRREEAKYGKVKESGFDSGGTFKL